MVLSLCKHKIQKYRNGKQWTETKRNSKNGHTPTETEINQHKWSETKKRDRNKQKQTETNRNGQKRTTADRNRLKQTERAKILYGPREKVGFQVFVYFRFFMKPELVH